MRECFANQDGSQVIVGDILGRRYICEGHTAESALIAERKIMVKSAEKALLRTNSNKIKRAILKNS